VNKVELKSSIRFQQLRSEIAVQASGIPERLRNLGVSQLGAGSDTIDDLRDKIYIPHGIEKNYANYSQKND
jgi:hypothetical protein